MNTVVGVIGVGSSSGCRIISVTATRSTSPLTRRNTKVMAARVVVIVIKVRHVRCGARAVQYGALQEGGIRTADVGGGPVPSTSTSTTPGESNG